jgi:site-specific DNA recombinase
MTRTALSSKNTARKAEMITVREYLRVSTDHSGRVRSHDEQHADNLRHADEYGWQFAGPPYKDVGSASRYARKAREGYDKLIDDLKNDRFGADVLIIWESSRGSRRVGEWAVLIDLCEDRNVKVHVTAHARTYDPSNPRDRRTLQEDAVDSEYESGKTSMRGRRAAVANAEEGKPHGRIPYGYRRIYDEHTGRFAKQVPKEGEAEVVRELFARLIKGHSLRSISVDFAQRGIRNDSGAPFAAPHLRCIAINPAYAAYRVHDPGRKTHGLSANARMLPGNWEPLVSKADFLAVKRILSAPERVTTRPGRGVHFLSMIAKCGVCGGKLAVRYSKDGAFRVPEYSCHKKSCIRISKAALDEFAENEIFAFMERDDLHASWMAPEESANVELAHVRDELATIRAQLDDLAEQVGSGRLSAMLAAKAEPALLARLQKVEARERELSTPNVLAGFLTPGSGVRRSWAGAEMSTKREVARLLFSREVIGELHVQRSPVRGHRGPVVERVEWKRHLNE